MNSKNIIAILLLSFLAVSCTNNKTAKIVAELDNVPIYYSELDNLIRQELYDELYRIYEIRENALSQLIGYKLIEKEAQKQNQSTFNYINNYIEKNYDKIDHDSIINKKQLNKVLVYRNNEFYPFDGNSLEGKNAKHNTIKAILLRQLIDSLEINTSIKKYIYPPISPELKIKDLLIHYRGNLNSKVEVVLISDFDCHNCIELHPMYEEIYNSYKEHAKFGFVNFSAYPTLSQVASEAAANQNRFWEYQNLLFNHKTMIDKDLLCHFADSLNLDINKFKLDIHCEDIKQKLELSNEKLIKSGIYATPSLLINNKLVVNSGSAEEICFLIEEAISNL